MFNTKEKCKKYSKVLIGMCLSMWMLDYKPTKLLQFMFSDNMSIAALRSKFFFFFFVHFVI